MSERAHRFQHAYRLMRARAGHQHWWPGDSAFEICIGAILTQNTSWKNVEHAIANLKKHQVLTLHQLHALDLNQLANLIRPAGCFHVKARRLRSFTTLIVDSFEGHLDGLFKLNTEDAREILLKTHGIGPETADCILLYAGNLPSFVVDAYTLRVFTRHHWTPAKTSYSALKTLCEENIEPESSRDRIDYWQDYHAQIVRIGKDYCRSKNPHCNHCPLRELLPPNIDPKSSGR